MVSPSATLTTLCANRDFPRTLRHQTQSTSDECMAIYRISDEKIEAIPQTTFAEQGLRERQDLQALLKKQIEVIAPDTLVVAEEFGDFEDSLRRIDLLAIDKNACLVVIELKRTEDGGHMELQALRYAAMVANMTFEKLSTVYASYLGESGSEQDASDELLAFLEWEDPDEEQFAQETRIVLASAEFSKELTTSVMWLNDYGLDIRCVRMRPYVDDGQTYLDVQTVIPLPEATDYQVRIREKKQQERVSRQSSRDFTKYDVTVADQFFSAQNKRHVILRVVAGILDSGCSPEQVMDAVPWRKNWFKVFDGALTSDQVIDRIMEGDTGGRHPLAKRYFVDHPFHVAGKTYVLSNQWGIRTLDAVDILKRTFSGVPVKISATST
jgi:hypothetical protein